MGKGGDATKQQQPRLQQEATTAPKGEGVSDEFYIDNEIHWHMPR